MGKSKLINAEIISSMADINYGFISMSEIKNKDEFFNSVRKIIAEYNNQFTSHILDWMPVSDELDDIDYDSEEIESSEIDESVAPGKIKIIQANISKKGYLTFEFNPSNGTLLMEIERFCDYDTLKNIKQGDEHIDFEVQDSGHANEELLSYVACLEDGNIATAQVDAYFNIDPDEEPDIKTDAKLREITDAWFDDIFKK
jgi:hypothetical protein